MNKKLYNQPTITIFDIEPTLILEGSTGAQGEDIPWAAKERIEDESDDSEDSSIW